MLQSLLILTQLREVSRRTAVQLIQAGVLLNQQAPAEKVLQQRMEAKAARLVFHRQQEQLPLSQLLQQQRRTRALQYMVTERTVKTLEQPTAEEKLAQRRR